MSDLEYTLYASYRLDASVSDEDLCVIAQTYGFERSASGFGWGSRDLEWKRDTALTPEEIVAVGKELQAVEDLGFGRYCVENWNEEYTDSNGDQIVEEYVFIEEVTA